jgi:putative iron-dependent peroxidase
MAAPQPGLFALGVTDHDYLEFSAALWAEPRELVAKAATAYRDHKIATNVNLVCGLRPEIWAGVNPAEAPRNASGFSEPVVGADGFTMPATQRDLFMWISAGSRSGVFDAARELVTSLRDTAVLSCEVDGWIYRGDHDLTGFIDGTENPTMGEAASFVLIPDGSPGAGGTVLLIQQWEHDADAWEGLNAEDQERVMGRTKTTSIELEVRADTAHSMRTDPDQYGHILRRNTAYGSSRRHGTVFIGLSAARQPQQAMLESMAGTAGPRDALTRHARPLTGAYYYVPAADDLLRFAR